MNVHLNDILILPVNTIKNIQIQVKILDIIYSDEKSNLLKINILDNHEYDEKNQYALKITSKKNDLFKVFIDNEYLFSKYILEEGIKNVPGVNFSFYCSEDNNYYYYISELYDMDLEAFEKYFLQLDMIKRLEIARLIYYNSLVGLNNLSKLNILHRDIQPKNILIKRLPKNKIKIALSDFGCSCIENILNCDKALYNTGYIDPMYVVKKMLNIDNISNDKKEYDLYALSITILNMILKDKISAQSILDEFSDFIKNKMISDNLGIRDIPEYYIIQEKLYTLMRNEIFLIFEMMKGDKNLNDEQYFILKNFLALLHYNIVPFVERDNVQNVLKLIKIQ
jgi:serine/threonine protein kinase